VTTPGAWPTGLLQRGVALVSAAPTTTCAARRAPVRPHRPPGRAALLDSASSPTATRSRRTRTAPGTPPASGSAPRR
jgi:hypothetical protein